MLFALGRHDHRRASCHTDQQMPHWAGFVLIIRHLFLFGLLLAHCYALDCSGTEFCPMIFWVADHALWAANNKLSTLFADICLY